MTVLPVSSSIRFAQVALNRLRPPDDNPALLAAMPTMNLSVDIDGKSQKKNPLLKRVCRAFGRTEAYGAFQRFKALRNNPAVTLNEADRKLVAHWYDVLNVFARQVGQSEEEIIDQLSSLFEPLVQKALSVQASKAMIRVRKSLGDKPGQHPNRHAVEQPQTRQIEDAARAKPITVTIHKTSIAPSQLKPAMRVEATPSTQDKRAHFTPNDQDILGRIFPFPSAMQSKSTDGGAYAMTTVYCSPSDHDASLLRISVGNSGLVALAQTEPFSEGEESCLLIAPGVLFGDLNILGGQSGRYPAMDSGANAFCIANGHIQRISANALKGRIKTDPEVALGVLRELAAYLGLLQDRLQVTSTIRAVDRLGLAYGLWERRHPGSSVLNPFNPLASPLPFKLRHLFDYLAASDRHIKKALAEFRKNPKSLASYRLDFFPPSSSISPIEPMPETGYELEQIIYDQGACNNILLTVKEGAVLAKFTNGKRDKGMAILTAGQCFGDMRWGNSSLPLVKTEAAISLLPGTKVSMQTTEEAIQSLLDNPESRLAAVSQMLDYIQSVRNQLSLVQRNIVLDERISVALAFLAEQLDLIDMDKQCYVFPVKNLSTISTLALCGREDVTRYFSDIKGQPGQPQFDRKKHTIEVPFAFVDKILGTDYDSQT